MKPSLQTRLAWFDAGATAFASACPTVETDLLPPATGPVYVCPLCVTRASFRAFLRDAVAQKELTAEHVPPRSAGGRPLVLTCAVCNHRAGTEIDAHAHVAGRLEPRPGQPLERPVRVTLGDRAVNMTLSADATGVRLFGEPNRNAPAMHAGFFDALGQLGDGSRKWNLGIKFHRDQFDPQRAAVSWLRAGYLAAFAKFGYRLVLDPAFHIVREKIASPSLPTPLLFGIRSPQANAATRTLMVLTEPAEIRGGLAVQMGIHIVLLPPPGDMKFYDRVHRRQGEAVDLTGTPMPWPSRPEFVYDLNSPE